MSREEDLELALDAAIHLLEVYEHGDSRCVSDEFVSLCCVLVNRTNDSAREILQGVLKTDYSEAKKAHQEYLDSQIVVIYGEEDVQEPVR